MTAILTGGSASLYTSGRACISAIQGRGQIRIAGRKGTQEKYADILGKKTRFALRILMIRAALMALGGMGRLARRPSVL